MYIPRRQSQGVPLDVTLLLLLLSKFPLLLFRKHIFLSYYLLDKMLHGCQI